MLEARKGTKDGRHSLLRTAGLEVGEQIRHFCHGQGVLDPFGHEGHSNSLHRVDFAAGEGLINPAGETQGDVVGRFRANHSRKNATVSHRENISFILRRDFTVGIKNALQE